VSHSKREVQNFGKKSSCETVTWEPEKEMGSKIRSVIVKLVVIMGGSWNWLVIVSYCGRDNISDYTTTTSIHTYITH
jgi:hypothetical protein